MPMWWQTYLDDRQITHLICVRLKHLLYDFLGGVSGLLPVVSYIKCPKHPLKKSPTPSQNGPLFVYFDVHYDKLHYKTQYLLRSMHITRNTIEDCAGDGSWKCATESKLPGSKDLESLGERRRRNKIRINKIRRGREKQT